MTSIAIIFGRAHRRVEFTGADLRAVEWFPIDKPAAEFRRAVESRAADLSRIAGGSVSWTTA